MVGALPAPEGEEARALEREPAEARALVRGARVHAGIFLVFMAWH